MMSDMQAMHYISLVCDAKAHNTDEENEQWQKANQNRLNQNFSMLAELLAQLTERVKELEGEE